MASGRYKPGSRKGSAGNGILKLKDELTRFKQLAQDLLFGLQGINAHDCLILCLCSLNSTCCSILLTANSSHSDATTTAVHA